jgi:hypothetical protein
MAKTMVRIDNDFSVSSDPALGARNVQNNGSTFEVLFNPAITVPKEAMNVKVSVERATTWYTYPNISASQGNNKFYVNEGVTPYVLTIPDGLYSLDQLSQTIINEGTNAGITNSPNPFIQLTGNEATQRVEITFGYDNISVDWNSDSPYVILGFTQGTTTGPTSSLPIPPADPLDYQYTADTVAGFNQVNEVFIKSDLVNDGIPLNNKFDGVLTNIQISVPPGSQQTYQPFRPLYCSGESLKSASRSNVRFYLTDENGNFLDTAGEYYTLTIRISYDLPMKLD